MDSVVNRVRKGRLGELEIRLLAYAQLRKQSVVRLGELRDALDLTAAQERSVLSRLARAGTIVRLRREVYLLPPELPLAGVWSPGQPRILQELMCASNGGRYQLCGWEPFRHHGLTDQVSNRLYAYNNRLSGDRTIGGMAFSFIKVADERLGGVAPLPAPDGVPIQMPTLARALMDAVYDWSRFNTLPAACQWIRDSVRKDPSLMRELVQMTCRFGNQGTVRRIGHVLAGAGLKDAAKARLARALTSKKSLIPLVPGKPANGPVDAQWGVIANE